MFKVRNKSKITGDDARPPMLRKVARKIGAIQHRWADQLQEKSERLSVTGKKLALGLFLAVFGGWSMYIAWQSLSSGGHQAAMAVQPITISHPGEGSSISAPVPGRIWVSEKEYRAIQAFHHYLDSMGQSMPGRLWRDSLLKARPGLLDSLQTIEQIYLTQPKK